MTSLLEPRDRAGPSGSRSAGRNELPLRGESLSHRMRTVRAVKPRALLERLLAGTVTNVAFSDAQKLLVALGFDATGKGQPPRLRSLWHFRAAQPSGPRGQAKPYQLRQLVGLVRRYDLRIEEDE